MNKELIGVFLTYGFTLILAIPLGKAIARWLRGEKSIWDFMAPLESAIYRFCSIDPNDEMNWKQHLKAMLTINLVWFIYGFVLLITQGSLFLNPDGNPSMTPDLAFNTVISFIVNCNLQHYSGETGVTYLTQIAAIAFFQFVSAATGIAVVFILFKALRDKVTDKLGNFWVFFVQSITRLLLPIAFVIAVILAFNGTPTSAEGKDSIVTLQGDSVQVSRGPAAGMIAIKHLGTNGGGWFGANSAHPLENPNYLTNTVELVAQVLIPIALVFALGFYLQRRKLAYVIFGVMTVGFLCLLIPTMVSEIGGSPAIAKMGVLQPTGAMEGKEVRFGPAISGYWSTVTTIISTGSVNSMHDSTMPLTGAMLLLGMMINSFYGGCGVGILNYFIFLIIAVFISGLMVGRTPEFLGRKIEAKEMKIASIIALLHPLIILAFTALSSYVLVHNPEANWAVKPASWLNNPGYHGFSEMLYEYTSSAANNGSGFEGLGDNNVFWNVTCGFALILGRYLPIIGPIAIAGLLAQKKYIPESAGTLKSDSYTFGLMTFAVIAIIAALAFFPALTLGPLAEYFSLY
ncbi:potassium-transporting ATPase subunit KdpA [Flavisolibacter tropicus]|uniref:Potassium-transporting ATPase potassium-binding subunit n=1 Tax=Flavisolibacter tropicus TaxID=1492898 RepID=A0A172TSL9_9BACT|nr:potassium-transporting ATPase subunit KdpA [Flavisolibacter tropicus]ANE50089.1 potassium ABC transporter ATPase [Flavisolibacter tropicus]